MKLKVTFMKLEYIAVYIVLCCRLYCVGGSDVPPDASNGSLGSEKYLDISDNGNLSATAIAEEDTEVSSIEYEDIDNSYDKSEEDQTLSVQSTSLDLPNENFSKEEVASENIDQYDSYSALVSEEIASETDEDVPEDNSARKTVNKTSTISQHKVSPGSQFIDECGCQKIFFYIPEQLGGAKLNSSCSDEGTQYNPDQKVISYSLPGTVGNSNMSSQYSSILENLHRMRRFYPGYSMRLYTDISLEGSFCRILCQNMDLFWCDIRNTFGGDQRKMISQTWKFLPLGDPSVELFLSRDLSKPGTEREAAAVEDWLQCNKTFHVMRDNRNLHNVAIMGGFWGARNDLLLKNEGDQLRDQMISMSKAPRKVGAKSKNFEQDILSRVIFYPRKQDIVAYDSYNCNKWKRYTMVRPFPLRRNTSFTGVAPANDRNHSKKRGKMTKCPVECRPSYGKHWDYC